MGQVMTKQLKAAKGSADRQDNSIMENHLNWLINGIDLETRRVEIRGEVNDSMASFITRNLLKMSQISNEPIEIYFSSYGGSVTAGLAIYDAIRACPCDVHIIASGEIMSMGFIIFLAGKKRTAAPHTRFMMHSISYGTEGITKNHEIQVNEAKAMNNANLDIMSKRTKRDKKFWARTILSHDKFFSVEEAIAVGVINAVNQPQAPMVKKVKPAAKVLKKPAKKVAKKAVKKAVK